MPQDRENGCSNSLRGVQTARDRRDHAEARTVLHRMQGLRLFGGFAFRAKSIVRLRLGRRV
jgi:hypothetical protein